MLPSSMLFQAENHGIRRFSCFAQYNLNINAVILSIRRKNVEKMASFAASKMCQYKKHIVAIFPFDVFIPTIENCTS